MAFTLVSIAIEMAILLVLYHVIFFMVLKHNIKELFASRPWWEYLTTYKGLFSKDTQVEVVYVTILTVHHFIGGFAMLYGYIMDNPTLFAHGAM